MEQREIVPRFCENGLCGKRLVRKEGETLQNWLNRRTCDKSCAMERESRRRRKKLRRKSRC